MNILSHLYDMGCLFNSLYAVIVILFMLMYLKKYDLFYSLTVILVTSSLSNAVLKFFFKVPLMPHLGPGYAFPSGHAQLGMVLWGWICMQHIIKKQMAFIILLIAGICMFHLNYHTPFEILAGYATGFLIIFLFKRIPILNYPEWMMVINSCLMIDIFKNYFSPIYLLFYVIGIVFLSYALLKGKK